MATSFRIRSVLICDDIRREINGKEICIGVYNGVIVLQRIPAVLSRLSVRLEFEGMAAGTYSFQVRVTDPAKNAVMTADGELEITRPDEPSAISFSASPVHLFTHGRYAISFGLGGQPRIVSRFLVRGVTSDELTTAQAGLQTQGG